MFKKDISNNAPSPTISQTLIGENLRVKGDIIGDGDIVIKGTLKGSTLKTKGKITIEKNAKVDVSNIEASELHISGEVNGNIKSDNVFIYEKSYLKGDITTKNIKVEMGAKIDGSIKMTQVEEKNPKNNKTKSTPALNTDQSS